MTIDRVTLFTRPFGFLKQGQRPTRQCNERGLHFQYQNNFSKVNGKPFIWQKRQEKRMCQQIDEITWIGHFSWKKKAPQVLKTSDQFPHWLSSSTIIKHLLKIISPKTQHPISVSHHKREPLPYFCLLNILIPFKLKKNHNKPKRKHGNGGCWTPMKRSTSKVDNNTMQWLRWSNPPEWLMIANNKHEIFKPINNILVFNFLLKNNHLHSWICNICDWRSKRLCCLCSTRYHTNYGRTILFTKMGGVNSMSRHWFDVRMSNFLVYMK